MATISYVGGKLCGERLPALSPRKCSFWAPSPNERLPPYAYPGLLIPPLPAPERYMRTIYHIIRS